MTYKHLFGPVPSRRLGVSLGVDLVPFKVCSLNCIYCEVGATNNLTLERKEYIPITEILSELDDYLSGAPQLDYITFSGAGEPTLNSGIGRVIQHIKSNYPQYRLALITNSTLFYDTELRAEIAPIDLVMPSLDAVTELVFKKLNRPNSKLEIDTIIDGLVTFKRESNAEMWLEIFLSPGLNDTPEELHQLKQACLKISPDRVQLNSLDRQGVEAGLRSMTAEEMESVKKECPTARIIASELSLEKSGANIKLTALSKLSKFIAYINNPNNINSKNGIKIRFVFSIPLLIPPNKTPPTNKTDNR